MNEDKKVKENVPVWARVILFFVGLFFLALALLIFLFLKPWWAAVFIAAFAGMFIHQAFSKNKKWIYEGLQGVFEMIAYACLGVVKLFQ